MSAFLVNPYPFTVSSSSGWLSYAPASNTNLDTPSLVARSSSNTASMTINLGQSKFVDTICIVSNLPAAATITVTSSGYNSGAVPAFTESKDPIFSTKTLIKPNGAATTLTITINAPAGTTFDIQRVVVGKRIETVGIDQNTEMSFEDQSVIETGEGWTNVKEFNVLPVWKVKMSGLSDWEWRAEFAPFFATVGQKKGVLFVPSDVPEFVQQSVFGRITSVAKGEVVGFNNWVASYSVTGLRS